MDHNEFRASIQKELTAGEGSLAGKYVAIFPGRKGLWNLLKYEFITAFIAGMRGALGHFLRKVFFPRIFKEVGKGCAFGRNITFRHPHKISVGANSLTAATIRRPSSPGVSKSRIRRSASMTSTIPRASSPHSQTVRRYPSLLNALDAASIRSALFEHNITCMFTDPSSGLTIT